jgi:3-oxoacyl-[acyl-carrier protein] reductase
LRVNLDGMFHVCREAGKVLRGEGALVTVSSTAGQRGEAGHADYAAAKGGVISLTKSLAVELAPRGIRVNCVAPGWVETDMSAPALRVDAAARRSVLGTIPLGRIATPEEVAGPILFLASSLARHITGEILNVNGGSVLCG